MWITMHVQRVSFSLTPILWIPPFLSIMPICVFKILILNFPLIFLLSNIELLHSSSPSSFLKDFFKFREVASKRKRRQEWTFPFSNSPKNLTVGMSPTPFVGVYVPLLTGSNPAAVPGSIPGVIFNISTSIIGFRIMSIPTILKVLRIILPIPPFSQSLISQLFFILIAFNFGPLTGNHRCGFEVGDWSITQLRVVESFVFDRFVDFTVYEFSN